MHIQVGMLFQEVAPVESNHDVVVGHGERDQVPVLPTALAFVGHVFRFIAAGPWLSRSIRRSGTRR